MAATLRLSVKGQEIVEQARNKKGWAKTASVWIELALTTEATLKRFWQRAPVQHETFINICKAVGVQWEEVTEESTILVISSDSGNSSRRSSQECLALIKQGVSVWNQWWRTNSQVRADLAGVELRGIDLKGIDLQGANLKGADLSGVDLSNALLCRADLTGANLSRADLSHVNLSRADLSGANLSRADLSHSLLIATQALGTNFTEAKFTGACLEDWNINSSTTLNAVICDYIYLKINQLERRPSGGNFAPEEFTVLFQQVLETIDLIFTNGIDWKAFVPAFQDLQVEYGEENLSIQSIEKKSNGGFVVRLEVPQKIDKEAIEVHLKELYEAKIKYIENKHQLILQTQREEIKFYRQQYTGLLGLITTMASKEIKLTVVNSSTREEQANNNIVYDLRDAQIAGNFNIANQFGEQNTFSLNEKQNLAEAATEIQKLLTQLEKTNPTANEAEKIEYINNETTPNFKRRVIGALQATSEPEFDELFLEHPYRKVVEAVIKGWMKAE